MLFYPRGHDVPWIQAVFESVDKKDVLLPMFSPFGYSIGFGRVLIVPNEINGVENLALHFSVVVDELFKKGNRSLSVFLWANPKTCHSPNSNFLRFIRYFAFILHKDLRYQVVDSWVFLAPLNTYHKKGKNNHSQNHYMTFSYHHYLALITCSTV